jgi:hypothetical protein
MMIVLAITLYVKHLFDSSNHFIQIMEEKSIILDRNSCYLK